MNKIAAEVASKPLNTFKSTLHIWNTSKYRKDIYRAALDAESLKKVIGHERFTVALKTIPINDKQSQTMTDLVANRPLQKDQIVSFYKMRIFRTAEGPHDREHYTYPYSSKYTFNVYGKSGVRLKRLIGDVSPESVPKAQGDIPYWAHFANEPDRKEEANTRIDRQVRQNFDLMKRKTLVHGSYIIYALVTTRDVGKGESLRYCYGSDYTRDYSTGCAITQNTAQPSFGVRPQVRNKELCERYQSAYPSPLLRTPALASDSWNYCRSIALTDHPYQQFLPVLFVSDAEHGCLYYNSGICTAINTSLCLPGSMQFWHKPCVLPDHTESSSPKSPSRPLVPVVSKHPPSCQTPPVTPSPYYQRSWKHHYKHRCRHHNYHYHYGHNSHNHHYHHRYYHHDRHNCCRHTPLSRLLHGHVQREHSGSNTRPEH